MQEIVKQFSGKRVLVIGDVMLDAYDFCYTEHSRPSPEKAGALVYRASHQLKVLGGAANVAANCVALGAETSLLGICGEDTLYHELQRLAEEQGMRVSLIRDAKRCTSVKTRLYIDDDYILRRDDECTDEVDDDTAMLVHQHFGELLDNVDVVILSDYNKGIFTEAGALAMIAQCDEAGIPVVVDFKPDNRSYFAGADIIAPNLAEAQAILPEFSLDDLQAGCETLHGMLSADNLLVTLGGEGICGIGADSFFKLPAHKVDVVDPVGCGDTVRAVLALAFASGLPLEQSAELANRAAALAVQKLGTATVSANELMDCIEK